MGIAMKLLPFMSSLAYIPTRDISTQAILKDLQVEFFRPANYQVDEEEFTDAPTEKSDGPIMIKGYDLSKPGYIGIPRWYARQKYPHVRYINRMVRAKRDPFLFATCTIKPRDERQKKFFDELATECLSPSPVDVVANAKTGAGKTAAVLHTIANHIQAASCIIVPKHKLMRQWYLAIERYFGASWAYENVGYAYSDKIDWEGKAITLAMLPSLALRDYGETFYRNFTSTWWDEFHNAGTPRGQFTLSKFPSAIRGGVTATNREDIGYRVQRWHMGPPRIKSTQEVMKAQAYVVDYHTNVAEIGISPQYMTSILAFQRADRHALLLKIIAYLGYARDRQMVILSDRVGQLEKLMLDCYSLYNIPWEAMGQVTGYRNGKPVKKANGWHRPKIKQSEDVQAEEAKKQIRFATYGIMGEGTDIPDLDWGLEATPRGKIVQPLGRIIRISEGKETPEWYSLNDLVHEPGVATGVFANPSQSNIYGDLVGTHKRRLRSFKEQGATVNTLTIQEIEALAA